MFRIKFVILSGSVISIFCLGILKVYFYRKKKVSKYPKNVVILHQYPPNKVCPSDSIFCLKLETWLRMNFINYQNEYVSRYNSKVPWISLNNKEITDSQICIEYLTKVFGKDLSESLNSIEKSISRSFLILCEKSLSWCILIHRYKYAKAKDIKCSYLNFILNSYKINKQSKVQGYGSYFKNQVYLIGKSDLKALNDFIKNKKFFFGDKPDLIDAVLFSITCQILYLDKGPFNEFLIDNCPNLIRHFNTVKKIYWSDWNTRIAQ